MVLTPAYCDTEITSPVTVNVVVTFGNGRDMMKLKQTSKANLVFPFFFFFFFP